MINEKINAGFLSLVVGLGMLIGKTTAFFITNSEAIFSDAVESVVHVLATGFALFSIIMSSKPADKTHLYGHGNIEYFSAGMEGLLIIIAAISILYNSISAIIFGATPSKLDIGVIIIGIAGSINFFLGLYLIKKGRKTNSLILEADGKHVLTDSYTSIGVVIGLLLVLFTKITIIDPLVALIVGLNIIFTGYRLIKNSISELMNETDTMVLKNISQKLILLKKNYWIDLHNLRFWTSADKVFLDFHLIIPYYFTIQESHNELTRINNEMNKEFSNFETKIHFDDCNFSLCKFCDYEKCVVRKDKKSTTVNWQKKDFTEKNIENSIN